MMFDVTLRTGLPMVELMQEENGDVYNAQIITPVFLLLPVGPGQMAPIQAGVLKLPMDKEALENLKLAVDEALPQVKKRSDLTIAGDMGQADQLAQMHRNAQGR